ncbi:MULTISPECIES: hypothetical protein [Marivita]|uniref:Uncharacterized protein n=1 Tax=Marivita cryptomonadis TaxID=505252 RepID=A0A9Q2PB03_9RHOB|nr:MULTISPECIES: hypothetical protein [Marivita]MCR9169496.1 hypothetical protein [Paracoccaceae bacterium]MBM2322240.1 hypothetical protein [Marivita cryptomonadis]MBM2331822.1 hypothetical protein [Marivita cryptomonadis]MBM2341406.1 hypothetical protein [Marivita cryptomonadis]MBM2346070.1 hypothetical protein [Marivita cryptomonadis]
MLVSRKLLMGGGATGIEFVAASEAQITSSTSLVINKPAGVVEGDIMVAFLTINSRKTISAPAGWTTILPHSGNEGEPMVAYKVAGSSEGASYSFPSGLGNLTGSIVAYRNTIYDTVGLEATASGGVITAPSITVAAADSVLLACFSASSGTFSSPTSGLTEVISDQDATNPNIIVYSEEGIAAGATGDKSVTNGSTKAGGVLLALGPA